MNSQGVFELSCQPRWLCHADVFHLCLLCSPTFWTLHLWSRLSARLPALPPLLFTLSTDTPPHLSSSVIVCQRRRMTESASRFSHHSKPLVYCSFWFLPHVPHLDLHLLHISLLNSQVALCSSSFFFASSIKIWSCCFLKRILDILIQRIIITISHSSPSSPSVHIL